MALIPTRTRALVIASNTSGLSIANNTATDITGWVATTNTLSGFNQTAGVFTAGRTGVYRFSLSVSYAPFTSAVNGTSFAQLVGPVTLSAFESFYASMPFAVNIFLDCAISLNAGQTVKVSTQQSSGVSRSLNAGAGNNLLTIEELAT